MPQNLLGYILVWATATELHPQHQSLWPVHSDSSVWLLFQSLVPEPLFFTHNQSREALWYFGRTRSISPHRPWSSASWTRRAVASLRFTLLGLNSVLLVFMWRCLLRRVDGHVRCSVDEACVSLWGRTSCWTQLFFISVRRGISWTGCRDNACTWNTLTLRASSDNICVFSSFATLTFFFEVFPVRVTSCDGSFHLDVRHLLMRRCVWLRFHHEHNLHPETKTI